MSEIFPDPVRNLPEADIPFEGCRAYLSQSKDHQIIFMEFNKDVIAPEHSHSAQYAVVLSGQIDLAIAGVSRTYKQGDQYFIPAGMPHSARIYAGYADITLFNEPGRYKVKQN
jgi:quercetin dioxygenase-like cupin family protein